MKRVIIVASAVAAWLVAIAGLGAYLLHEQAALLSKPPTQGTAFLIEGDFNPSPGLTNAWPSIREVVRKRASRIGTRIYWEQVSETRARVLVPILNPHTDLAKEALFRGGMLEFRLVHEQSDELTRSGELPPGYAIVEHQQTVAPGRMTAERLVVKQTHEPGLGGNLVRSAAVMRGALREPAIDFALEPDAAAAFARVTREHVGQRLAIMVDGTLFSAPVIQSPIEGGKGQISGRFDEREAFELAAALESPLPAPVRVIEAKEF